MCNVAAQLCDELTVLVCSLKREPIDGHLRHKWMKELLPQARVLHLSEDVPQEPAEDPNFWKIWVRICKAAHPAHLDFVFGSEPYVLRLAQELDAKPILIDPERLAFPVSGSEARENPAARWEMLPGPVRPYFQKRVVLVGAESTGKSTLARDLAKYMNTRYVPEYGRVYDSYRQGDWSSGLFEVIEAGHNAMRNAIAPMAGPILLEDTDELMTRVWEEYLTGRRPIRSRPVKLADLYLLLSLEVPWQDDQTRYQGNPAERYAFQALVERELVDSAANWRSVGGTGSDRLQQAIYFVRKELSGEFSFHAR